MLMSLYISHMYYALINIPRPRNHKYNGLETHDQDHNGLDSEREGRSGSLVKTNIPHFCDCGELEECSLAWPHPELLLQQFVAQV